MSEEERESRIINQLEKRIESMETDLSGQIDELRESVANVVVKLSDKIGGAIDFLTHMTQVCDAAMDLRCIVRSTLVMPSGDLGMIETLLKDISDVNQSMEELRQKAVVDQAGFKFDLARFTDELQWSTFAVIGASRRWGIDFSELAAALTEKLGAPLCRKAVKREDILKTYGPDAVVS